MQMQTFSRLQRQNVGYLFLLFSLLLLSNCSECHIDQELQQNFDRRIKIVQNWEEESDIFITTKEYIEALMFLGELTGHYSSVDLGGSPGYLTKEDYDKDMNVWKSWYKENKCKHTTHYVPDKK